MVFCLLFDQVFRERYNILYQRTMRHELFSPVAEGANQNQVAEKFALKPVEFLLGSTAKLGQLIVLGMMTQIKEGKYFLEDPTGVVELNLRQATFHTGLYTENCFVLAKVLMKMVFFMSKHWAFHQLNQDR